jgi:hypothetical protein
VKFEAGSKRCKGQQHVLPCQHKTMLLRQETSCSEEAADEKVDGCMIQ